jgi:hypothetical protein
MLSDRKLKKQIEEEILADVLDEVVLDFMSKLAARAIQEAKKQESKEKEEAGNV